MDLGPIEQLRAETGDDRPVAELRAPEEVASALGEASSIAVDLETNAFHAYRERMCLVQLATPTADAFMDPVREDAPVKALQEQLNRPGRAVIMHAGDNDVRVFKASWGWAPPHIFDTALAARILGAPKLGLRDLLEAHLGVVIDKGEQRSDWSRRPLTVEQLRYARQDVRWLIPLADALGDALHASGRASWHAEECARAASVEPPERAFDREGWRSVKSAKGLGKRGRAVMAELWAWRESLAEARDLAPFRVLQPDVVARLAKFAEARGQGALQGLDGLRFLPPSLDRADLARALERGLEGADPGATRPRSAPRTPPPVDPEGTSARMDRLKARRSEWSARLGLDPGFLLANATLARIAKAAPRDEEELRRVDGVGAWRTEALGEEILDVVRL